MFGEEGYNVFQFKHCTIIRALRPGNKIRPRSFQFKHCTIISHLINTLSMYYPISIQALYDYKYVNVIKKLLYEDFNSSIVRL